MMLTYLIMVGITANGPLAAPFFPIPFLPGNVACKSKPWAKEANSASPWSLIGQAGGKGEPFTI
jgi:hypothetical protein